MNHCFCSCVDCITAVAAEVLLALELISLLMLAVVPLPVSMNPCEAATTFCVFLHKRIDKLGGLAAPRCVLCSFGEPARQQSATCNNLGQHIVAFCASSHICSPFATQYAGCAGLSEPLLGSSAPPATAVANSLWGDICTLCRHPVFLYNCIGYCPIQGAFGVYSYFGPQVSCCARQKMWGLAGYKDQRTCNCSHLKMNS